MTRPRGTACASILAALALLGAGCSAYDYHSGRFFEATRNYFRASEAYESYLRRDSAGPRAAEVNARLGDLYGVRMERCLDARRHYEAALRLSVPPPWEGRARLGIMNCPDYFPMGAGRFWVYGDSQSQGRNMRLEWEVVRSSADESAWIRSSLFAGGRTVRSAEDRYEKSDWRIYAYEGPAAGAATILRYPFRQGESWTERRGGTVFTYRIESTDAAVKTAAGRFEGCLKVREANSRIRGSWKYDYYAPSVGRVKTTIAGPGFENSNTELLKYGTGQER